MLRNKFNETPHLDALAKRGLRFTHAYASAPVCSPYRAAFLTGQYPARVGILDYLRPDSENGLSTRHTTLPEMLQKNGYTTGMIGKWHLSGYTYHGAKKVVRPIDHGFGWNTGSEIKGVGNGANFYPYVFRTQPISWIDLPKNKLGKSEYLTDRLNHEAIGFIEKTRTSPSSFICPTTRPTRFSTGGLIWWKNTARNIGRVKAPVTDAISVRIQGRRAMP